MPARIVEGVVAVATIDIARLIGDLPGVGVHIPVPSDVRGYVQQANAVAAGVGNSLSEAFSGALGTMAIAVPAPAGPMIAAGGAFVSVFSSLFGGDPPPIPPSTIGGQDGELFLSDPLRTFDSAVIAGKVVAKDITASDTQRDAVVETVAKKYRLVTKAMANNKSVLDDGSPLDLGTKRRLAFFLVYAGHKYTTKTENHGGYGDVERGRRLAQASKLVEWAMPRVHLRELLTAWFFYRISLAGYVATGGRPSGELPGGRCATLNLNRTGLDAAAPYGWDVRSVGGVACAVLGHTVPVPWFPVVSFNTGVNEDWPTVRKLADTNRGHGVGVWRHAIKSLAMPLPIVGNDGSVAYAPLDPDIVADELRDRYAGSNGFVVFEAGKTWRVKFPRSSVLTEFPETWTEAVRHSIMLARTDATHVAAVEDALDQIPRLGHAASGLVEKVKRVQAIKRAQAVKRLVDALAKVKKAKKAPAQKHTGLIVGGAVAAAASLFLLLR